MTSIIGVCAAVAFVCVVCLRWLKDRRKAPTPMPAEPPEVEEAGQAVKELYREAHRRHSTAFTSTFPPRART